MAKPRQDFPIKTYEELSNIVRDQGQKNVYQMLVTGFGREETLEGLSQILPREVVRLQLNVLCPKQLR